jgi:hypothetical protein
MENPAESSPDIAFPADLQAAYARIAAEAGALVAKAEASSTEATIAHLKRMIEKGHIVISVMGLTPECARQIQFTAPYANTVPAVYGSEASPVSSAETIGTARIAAARGTTRELAISASAPRANLMRTEDHATAAAACICGRAELRATNSIVVQAGRQAEPRQGIRAQIHHPAKPGPYGCADGPE